VIRAGTIPCNAAAGIGAPGSIKVI